MRVCAVCKGKFYKGDGSVFRVPKDELTRRKWSEICGVKLSTSARVCHKHFLPSSIINVGGGLHLLPNAEPCIEHLPEAYFLMKSINMHRCCICRKKVEPGSGPFFTVPKDVGRRKEWSEKCGIDLSPNAHICIDHFCSSDIITAGSRFLLLPKAVPIVKQPKSETPERSCVPTTQQNKQNPKKILNSSGQRKKSPETHDKVLKSSINCIPPQLEEPVVQMPAIEKVFCAGLTQTNVRLCGLVEASEMGDEFRFSCFYCCHVFPLDKWKDFVNHLEEKHSQEEEAFRTSKYLSKEHDYTPISFPTPSSVKTELMSFDVEPINSSSLDPLGSVNNPFESVVFQSSLNYTPYKSEISHNGRKTNQSFVHYRQRSKYSFKERSKRKKVSSNRFYSKLSKKHTGQRSTLSRCLKRTIEVELKPANLSSSEMSGFNVNYEDDSMAAASEISTEIAFDYTSQPIVDLLLDSMKIYPVLWQFDNQPFNEGFFEAAEDLCATVNKKFSLNIDNLKMRRSINRILRFYCSTYPNENNDPLTYYYSKCATFLPPADEIAYARCSHCYLCFANDFDLKLHLDNEQKYLEWPYKCPQCKESFRLLVEFELHKHLPHYAETFRCQPCELSFFHRSAYTKHMVEEHQSKQGAEEFICELCDKVLFSAVGLRNHKKTHGTAVHKCNLCPKAYHDKSKLALHLKTHGRQYDFMCEVCGKKFIKQCALTVHMAKHTGEKVTCKICNLRLRKSSLSRHLKVVHIAHAGSLTDRCFKGKLISFAKLFNSTKRRRCSKKEFAGERHYKCKICKVNFDNYKLTVEHNKEYHSGCPKLQCKMCTSAFRSKLNLKAHYRKKHKWHPFQIYKLIEENASLEEVLSLDLENINLVLEDLKHLRNNPEDNNSQKKTDYEYLTDEMYFTDENIPSSTIQDEIMKVDIEVVGAEAHDIKLDYINDMLTEYLEEE